MKKRLVSILLSICAFSSIYATHIVGGEFQMVEQRSGLYDIFLHLYFDEINGNPQAEDISLIASIFAKSDDRLMRQIEMDKVSKSFVEYENPDCANDRISTSKITYAARRNDGEPGFGFQFTSEFDEPEGYYIVWDRCCRNGQIVNIINPGDAGMLFYLHFPRIFDSNANLIGWSSPVFTEIPGTYACINEPFELDFSASDVDGDSLRYSMRNPLAGFSNPNNPNPSSTQAEPYPEVNWVSGINTFTQIPGNPALSVHPATGILTVTPSQGGLHVFSVLCEEFRNGVKIGELRRDFQVFVYTECEQNRAPSAGLILPDSSIYVPGDTIRMSTADLTCFDLFVTDNADLRNNEAISVKVVPVNFSLSYSLVNPGDDKYVGGLGDTLLGWQICTPQCKDIMNNGPFIYDVIVSDDACPAPKRDTIRVILDLIVAPNTPPTLTATSTNDITVLANGDIQVNVFEIDTIVIDFTGLDADSNNILSLTAIPDRFSLNDFGMEFENVTGASPLSSSFEWIITCDKLEGSTKDNFAIDFVVNDGSCDDSGMDTINVKFNINYEVVSKDFVGYNVFTPNDDGINEKFVISNLPRDNCENQYVSFEIYNRWGRKIYETNSRKVEWDGDDISDGVYFYVARYTEHSYKGHFTILR